MRRRLVIVRHAKSSWDDPSLDDHDRPLSPRGRTATARLRAHFAATGLRPDLVLCSSARRTVETLEGMRSSLPDDVAVEIGPELYAADARDHVARLRDLDAAHRTVVLIGHNPAVQDLTLALVGDGDADGRRQLALKFPTGAAATLSFDAAWADLGPGEARLDELFVPRRARPE